MDYDKYENNMLDERMCFSLLVTSVHQAPVKDKG